MKIIVGLGNPDAKYNGTRHNIGFSAIVGISDATGIKVNEKKHKAIIGKGMLGGEKVILAMPQTYMNLSGESVREIMDYYKCDPDDVLVIYDDIALDVGKLRIREKGSAGGHNGIKNIIQHLGTDAFPRIRIGVGEKPAKMDLADYVLGRFDKDELPVMREAIEKVVAAAELIVAGEVSTAMNRYN